MSKKMSSEAVSDNGKPEREPSRKLPKNPAGNPVIRTIANPEDELNTQELKKLVPAFALSGLIHIVVIGFLVAILPSGRAETTTPDDNKIVTTEIAEPEAPMENFQIEDIGDDSERQAATASDREEAENVQAPTVPDEAIGREDQEKTQPTQTFSPPGLGPTDIAAGNTGAMSPDGSSLKGDQGGGSDLSVPGMRGRSGSTKDKLLKEGGGNSISEAAVASGLHYLARQQKPDGRWEFDGTSKDDLAATGLCLLPFLAAGETHKTGKTKEYRMVVAKGLTWLSSRQKSNGDFTGNISMYSRGIVTIALCEAYGMTQDPSLRIRAQSAVNFICNSQAKDGSWGYTANAASGDSSITGWEIQAMRSAKSAGLSINNQVWNRSKDFLVSVSAQSESQYGYRSRKPYPAVTSVALLCRQYMGWGPQNPSLARGVEYLQTQRPPKKDDFDMYYYYYATQVFHFFGGKAWEDWNLGSKGKEFKTIGMRDMLIQMQHKDADAKKGSWIADNGFIGDNCGRLGTTCLALLTLEVYYRHLPLYKRNDGGGLAELDR